MNNSWSDGPRNVLFKLECLRSQPKAVQLCVMVTVRSSAWFAHSEAILQTMLCSSDQEERLYAINKIKDIRGSEEFGDKSLRQRKLPFLHTEAKKLQDINSWDDAHEPLSTCDMTIDQIEKIQEAPMKAEYFPCHTQGIERAVKEVTAAASAVYGADRRDGFIRGRALHRELMPKINSKQDLAFVKMNI